jgi:hypothetical protein
VIAMRVADMSTGASRLREAAEVLMRAWEDTRPYWNDANSRNIEEQHLAPLMKEVTDALQAVTQYHEILSHGSRECQPW